MEVQGNDAGQSFGRRVDQMGNTAQEAWMRTRDAISDLKQTLDIDGRVQRSPYGTMAAAIGIGYVLGGGIFSSLTSRILGLGVRIGVRLAAIPFLEEMLGMVDAGSQQQYGRSPSMSGEAGQSQTTNKG